MNSHFTSNPSIPQPARPCFGPAKHPTQMGAPTTGATTATRAQLAHVVHLSEGTLLLVAEGAATHGWRDRFRARLRTCGPWNEGQVQDYFLLTYGIDARRWPISKASIARIFAPDQLDRSIAVARDTPEVRAFLS